MAAAAMVHASHDAYFPSMLPRNHTIPAPRDIAVRAADHHDASAAAERGPSVPRLTAAGSLRAVAPATTGTGGSSTPSNNEGCTQHASLGFLEHEGLVATGGFV